MAKEEIKKKKLLKEIIQGESVQEKLQGDYKLNIGKNIILVKDDLGKVIRRKVISHTGDHGIVQQDQKDETDIKNILEKYGRTGMLPVQKNPGMYDDFSDIPDYMEAQNQIRKADEAFAELPSKLRERFGNNPAEMIKFLGLEENKEESYKLGLRAKPEPIQEVIQKVEVINQIDKQSKNAE